MLRPVDLVKRMPAAQDVHRWLPRLLCFCAVPQRLRWPFLSEEAVRRPLAGDWSAEARPRTASQCPAVGQACGGTLGAQRDPGDLAFTAPDDLQKERIGGSGRLVSALSGFDGPCRGFHAGESTVALQADPAYWITRRPGGWSAHRECRLEVVRNSLPAHCCRRNTGRPVDIRNLAAWMQRPPIKRKAASAESLSGEWFLGSAIDTGRRSRAQAPPGCTYSAAIRWHPLSLRSGVDVSLPPTGTPTDGGAG